MRLYCENQRSNAYPAPGGLSDQSQSFLDFCSIVTGERSKWDEIRRESK